MRHSKWFLVLLAMIVAAVPAVLIGSGAARGHGGDNEICGPIASTLVITENSRLTCDVDCFELDSPCIQFGRSHIKLRLNGFKLTGPANPPDLTNCRTPASFLPADGIHSTFDHVTIEGPGLVQKMARHGIALFATAPDFVEHATVKKLVSHQNCFSGIWLVRVSDSRIDQVVSARNSAASQHFPCGGTCITNSNDNRIRRSEFSGNGSVAPGPDPSGPPCPMPTGQPNDFGIGLVGTSSGNVIEENGIGGNINGILVCPGAAGNLIRENVIVGNPPIQVAATSGPSVGADIRDFSPAGANTYDDNLCVTSTQVSGPPLCPNIPNFSGHKNN
jgi:hypothetical protein